MTRALLFDIDGTCAQYLDAFNQVLGRQGHEVDHDRYARELQGFSTQSICDCFLSGEQPERQVAIMQEKEAIVRSLVAGEIVSMPDLLALLDRADIAGTPMVAVTNAPPPNAEILLGGPKITNCFKAVIIGDELVHRKPHPPP